MDRRKFLKDVSVYGAGVTAAVPVLSVSRHALAAEGGAPVVSEAEGSDWKALPKKAIDALGGIKKFVKPGSRVVIKPNASFNSPPELAANVHPDVMRSVIEQVLATDPKEVIVFDRTLAEERSCYENSGIGAVLESIKDDRVKLDTDDERKYVPVKIDKGIAFTTWKFYKPAIEADHYINIAVAKHHGSAKLTLGLKNILGIIGGNRSKIHWSLDQGIADLNTVVRPTLTIIDGTRILLRNGPRGGNIEDVEIKNKVLASADTVAVDAYAAKSLFGMEPEDLDHVKIAAKMGLGEMDLENKVKIVKA